MFLTFKGVKNGDKVRGIQRYLESQICVLGRSITYFLSFVPAQKYWTWTKTTPQKKSVFQVESPQNWRQDNLFYSNVWVTKIWSHWSQSLVKWPYLQHNLIHVMKFCWWCHGYKLRRHKLYFKVPHFEEVWSSLFSWNHQSFNHVD